MSNFWSSKTGEPITGDATKAFLQDFSLIPNNTMAQAKIHKFTNVTKINSFDASEAHYLEIIWKITTGEFKSREVSQKIKCFDGTPESIDRNLNMLKLIMDLCKFVPVHENEPTDSDLLVMVGKECGIKIREWSMPKKDNSGFMEGNFVTECYAVKDFITETGVKLEPKQSRGVESALTRNPRGGVNTADLNDDIPF